MTIGLGGYPKAPPSPLYETLGTSLLVIIGIITELKVPQTSPRQWTSPLENALQNVTSLASQALLMHYTIYC